METRSKRGTHERDVQPQPEQAEDQTEPQPEQPECSSRQTDPQPEQTEDQSRQAGPQLEKPEESTGLAAMMRQMLAQSAAQSKQMAAQSKQMADQSAALKTSQAELKEHVTTTLAEHSERLEQRLMGQVTQEMDRVRQSFQREVTAVSDRVDVIQRGQDLQQQQLTSQQQRMDSLVGEQESQHKEVGEKLFALSGRLDAVQRELYHRVATVEGTRVTESLSSAGGSRPISPVREGGSVRIKTRPIPYDGRTSWVGYKAQFDLISDLNGWSTDDRARYLAASLAGPALMVLTNLSATERLSYVHLTEALNTRFNEGRSAELARVKLDNRRQLPNEKLAQYASEVESLTQLAYPTAGGDARDILTRERFLKGLFSGELRKQIKLSRPATFAEMLGMAIELDAVLQGEAEGIDRGYSRRPAIVRQVREEDSSPRKRARGACFLCGSLSHQQAQCSVQSSSRSLPLNGNSRRNNQAADADARTRRESRSNNACGRSEQVESSAQNTSADVLSAIETLSKRVDALAARQPRDVSNNAGRSYSVPRDAAPRRGECFECHSPSHYRNQCPLLLSQSAPVDLN